jgi:hypothetical protein
VATIFLRPRPVYRKRRQPPRSVVAAATAYTLTAPDPASGAPLVASGNFTVTLNGLPTGTIVVTPSDGGDGGTFTPTTLSFTGATTSLTFTYTPDDSGTKTISTSDDGGLTDPASVEYEAARTVAADFYVNASTGDDGDAGTSSGAAWETMTKANAGPSGGYIAGDTLTFEGTVSGNLVWTTSGTQSARCVIRGDSGTISCGTGIGVMVHGAEFVTVEDLIITGAGTGFTDFEPGGATGFDTSVLGHGVYVYDDRTSGDKLRSVFLSGLTVSGTQFGITLATPNYGQEVVGFRDVRVWGCDLSAQIGGFWCNGGDAQGLGWGWQKDLAADTKTTFMGLLVHDCVIHDCTGINGGACGFGMLLQNLTGGLVLRVVLYDISGDDSSNPYNWTSANMSAELCDSVVLRNCEAYNNLTNQSGDGAGFDWDVDTTNCVFEACYAHDNKGPGFMVGGGASGARNVCRFCVARGNQTLVGDGEIRQWGDENLVYHNTCVVTTAAHADATALRNNGSTTSWFINNVLVTVGGRAMFAYSDLGAAHALGNVYYPSGGALDFDGSVATLADWRSAGQETRNGVEYGTTADPALSDPLSGVGAGVMPAELLASCTQFDPSGSGSGVGAGFPLHLIPFEPGPADFHGYPAGASAGRVDAGAVVYGAEDYVPGYGAGGTVVASKSRVVNSGGI